MNAIVFLLACVALSLYLDDQAKDFERIETTWKLRVALAASQDENQALRSALRGDPYPRALPRGNTLIDMTRDEP